jgi:cellulose synthase/poly-beta-1,6-N-acetylglucosamine synthase-like glycosyltransferase
MRSIAAQDHGAFELIVVDDRSSDRTPELLQRLARELPALKVLRIEVLPEGWGGQNHALRKGVDASTGEWLCFTDADCIWRSPRTLSIAAREASGSGAQLLSLLPQLDNPSPWEQLAAPLCIAVFMLRLKLGEVNAPEKPAAYANGAFLYIRRETYEALGGHGQVKGQLNDDIALAKLAKQRGLKLRLAANADLYSTRMYGTPSESWRGWTRNFRGTLVSPSEMFKAALQAAVLFLAPWAGLAAALAARDTLSIAAFAAAVLVSHAGAALVYPAFGARSWASLFYPLAGLFVTAVALKAALGAGRTMTWEGAAYGEQGAATAAPPKDPSSTTSPPR